ncbi:MAG: transketolase family protein, partial [Parasporobacterium sp.]|nr:transketolase family protein [Parasporobacterium sp.]
LMRTIPGMVVINPCDDTEARAAVKAAYEYEGPVYLRFGRLAVPVMYDPEDFQFEIGKGIRLKEGNDLTIIATGLEVYESMMAAEQLEKELGISIEVIDIHTIKPIDGKLIAESAAKTGKVVTVEEHSVIGGLFSAVSEVLAKECPVKVFPISCGDGYGHSGPAVKLLHEYRLDAEGIAEQIKEFLGK